MRARRTTLVAVAALTTGAAVAIAPTPVAVAQPAPPFEVVASGLLNPRGLTFGADGTLYVAEAGVGGPGPCQPGPEGGDVCFGTTGGVTAISPGVQQRVLDNMPSLASEGGFAATGPHDVGLRGPQLFASIGLGGDLAFRAGFGSAASLLGHLVRANGNTTRFRSVADLAAFEEQYDPDGGEPDSNPYGLAVNGGRVLVADAGGNDLLNVRTSGVIDVEAVFPTRLFPLPFPPFTDVPTQAVPTGVTIGPDGAAYVGQLTGFPFPIGGAQVYRVANGQTTVYATGFTNIIDVAFGPDGTLYVLEFATNSLLDPDSPGALWAVAPDGSKDLVASEGLVAPGGVAVDADGQVFVTNFSVTPFGQVVIVPT